MSEVKKEIQLEIAHVLFIDIVGYSKLSINEQHAAIDELNRAVRTDGSQDQGDYRQTEYGIRQHVSPSYVRPRFCAL
jgi:hypothetical protein